MPEMKACTQCGPQVGPKPLSEFYKHPKMADGHLSKCKTCIKANVKAYAKANPDKIRKLTREKKRRPAYRKKEKEWIERNLDRSREIKSQWEARNRDKKKAEWTLNNAIRDGKIKRGTVCQKCGATENIESHHPDYSKPLEVEWLCTTCHGETRHKS